MILQITYIVFVVTFVLGFIKGYNEIITGGLVARLLNGVIYVFALALTIAAIAIGLAVFGVL